jgi:hypothetical protein
MTEEEVDALDEIWTKTTPKIRKGEESLPNTALVCCCWTR